MESTLVCDNRTDNIEVAKQHYADTRRDYLSVGFDESAELGYIWRINVERFLRGFIDRTDVSTQELMRELNARAFYDFTVTEPLITPSIRWYARTLERSYGVKLDELPPEICESEHLPDERCESRLGRRLSSDFLYRLTQVAYLKRNRSLKDGARVLEVGAGYGALARTILLSVPSARYVIVDIPETLFFAEMFLRASFPDKTFAFVGKDTSDEEIQGADIVFVPTGFRDRINGMHFDLGINTNSLGEMPLTVSRSIIDWLTNDVRPARFYSLNRFLNRVSPQQFNHRAEAVGCTFLWGANWDVVDWEVNPEFEQCPYYVSIVTRNLSLVVSYRKEAVTLDEKEAALELSEVGLQDWFRKPYWDDHVLKSYGPALPLMSKINPDLTPDLKRSGTLFFLWNMIRLSRIEEHASLARQVMVEYLKYLGGTAEPLEDLLFFIGKV